MHELAICQSLLREVEVIAARHGGRKVMQIVVAIGPLAGVESQLLQRAFTVARAGTVADQAVLDVETGPVAVWCETCGAETFVPANALLCGGCGTWQVRLKSGDEMQLKRVELAEVAAAI